MKRMICVVVALAAAPGLAQKHTVVQEPDREVARKKTTLDFTEVVVGGDYLHPGDTLITAGPKPEFPNLIKIRGSFAPELQKSADQL